MRQIQLFFILGVVLFLTIGQAFSQLQPEIGDSDGSVEVESDEAISSSPLVAGGTRSKRAADPQLFFGVEGSPYGNGYYGGNRPYYGGGGGYYNGYNNGYHGHHGYNHGYNHGYRPHHHGHHHNHGHYYG